jgi:hypothetical protein
MPLALLTLTIAQLFDLGTFVRMVTLQGPGSEANPLVHLLLTEHGLPLLIVAKIVVLSLVVAIVAVLSGRTDASSHRRMVTAIISVAIVAGLIGGWSNSNIAL